MQKNGTVLLNLVGQETSHLQWENICKVDTVDSVGTGSPLARDSARKRFQSSWKSEVILCLAPPSGNSRELGQEPSYQFTEGIFIAVLPTSHPFIRCCNVSLLTCPPKCRDCVTANIVKSHCTLVYCNVKALLPYCLEL